VADYNDLLVAGQDFAYSKSIAYVVLKLQVKYTSLQAKYTSLQAELKFISEVHEKSREVHEKEREERKLELKLISEKHEKEREERKLELKLISEKHEKEREERKLANEERARVFEELGRLREKAVQLDALLGNRDRRVHQLMENSRGMGHWMRLSSRFAGAE
jgi:hypothetical protein